MTIQNYAAQMGNYTLREELYEGRTHVVAPVILMVEGVHNGSGGPVLYTADELSRFACAWNGRPVPVGHPKDGDEFVSCNNPNILEQQVIGQVFKAHYLDGKLRGEIWIDKAKASRISPEALGCLLAGVAMDVSTGMYNDQTKTKGTWNGEDYIAIARNLRPDHLALLPGGEGACSWKDGCGVRANETNGGDNVKRTLSPGSTDPGPDEHVAKARELISAGWLVTMAKPGFRDTMGRIQEHLNGLDSPTTYHYVEEVFDKYFIYQVVGNDSGDKYYRQTYSLQDGKLVLGDGATEVRREVKFPDVVTNEIINNDKGDNTMNIVDELIKNEATAFEESDREWLVTLSECRLKTLVPKVIPVKVEPEKETPDTNEEKEAPATFGKDEAIAAFKEQLSTPEQFLDLMPPEIKDQFKSGLSLHTAARQSLIDTLLAYSKVFTTEELQAKDMDELGKLVKLIPLKRDFSGLGNNSLSTDKALGKLLPAFVTMAKEKEEGGKS